MIVFIKTNYINVLRELKVKTSTINSFLKDFNTNIASQVESAFADDYEEHLKQITDFKLEENETKLLWDTIEQGRIGFDSKENLKYEDTFTEWRDLNALNSIQESEQILEDEDEDEGEHEAKLHVITDLIDQYFDNGSTHLDKILFVVADFGKGKSVFFKHYAARLAKEYLSSKEGEFPVYFNLRNFNDFEHNTTLGVIEDYLLSSYAIDIKKPYFQKKKPL